MTVSPAAQKVLDKQTELFDAKQDVKLAESNLEKHLQGMAAHKALVEAQAAVERAKEGLKRATMSDPEFNRLQMELTDRRADVNDIRGQLSSLLVAYFAETKERSLEIDDKQSVEVIVTGKLGKVIPTQLRLGHSE